METKENKIDYKKQYEKIFTENIKRDGATSLLKYLKESDFFDAPASTRFHSNCAGGLVEHTVKVYERFVKMLECEYGADWRTKQTACVGVGVASSPTAPRNDVQLGESAAIIALLHDVCKVGCYKTEERNVKVGTEWTKKPFYTVDDPLPYGHGEKSVYMISGFMKLTREEAMAINWHMGGYDDRNSKGSYILSEAFNKFPLALLFHVADLLTSYLDEVITK